MLFISRRCDAVSMRLPDVDDFAFRCMKLPGLRCLHDCRYLETPSGEARQAARQISGTPGASPSSFRSLGGSSPDSYVKCPGTRQRGPVHRAPPPSACSASAANADNDATGDEGISDSIDLEDRTPRLGNTPYSGRYQSRDGKQGPAREGADGASDAANALDWEDAIVLVVGAGGREVPGRGKLDWCEPCEAHVLVADVEVRISQWEFASR